METLQDVLRRMVQQHLDRKNKPSNQEALPQKKMMNNNEESRVRFLQEKMLAPDSAYLQILLFRLKEARQPRAYQFDANRKFDELAFDTDNPQVAARLSKAIDAVSKAIKTLQELSDTDQKEELAFWGDEVMEPDYLCGIPELDNWTPPPPKTWIISVRPKWARAFFAKENPKTIELRKGHFGATLRTGDKILIYSTAPKAAIIGSVTVRSRKEYKLPTLLKACWQGELARVTEQEFADYYGDADVGVGVWVENPQLLDRPIPLATVRELWGAWQPPQQIQQLSDEQISALAMYVTNHQPKPN
jgi:predicted transcriptional regulator